MQAASAPGGRAVPLSGWLGRLRHWVMAEPQARPLLGQRCDRLRPRFIAHALEQELPRQLNANAELVEWQWDSSTGRVSGLLLTANLIQRFQWIPGVERFRLQPVAELRKRRWPLSLLR